ncbi:MAG: carboxypeptidase-like regulatory domain-containing protein [Gemmatimonadaceae bacterium]
MASLFLSGCRRRAPEDINLLLHRCTTHVQAKGREPQLPRTPSPRAGRGVVIGTLADSGGALPNFSILATTPGNAPNAQRASATADSLGGFVFDALAPGRYRLLVRAYAHRPDSTDVDVIAGQVDTVRLRPLFYQCMR